MVIGRPSQIVWMEAGRQTMGSNPEVDSDRHGVSVTWGFRHAGCKVNDLECHVILRTVSSRMPCFCDCSHTCLGYIASQPWGSLLSP